MELTKSDKILCLVRLSPREIVLGYVSSEQPITNKSSKIVIYEGRTINWNMKYSLTNLLAGNFNQRDLNLKIGVSSQHPLKLKFQSILPLQLFSNKLVQLI